MYTIDSTSDWLIRPINWYGIGMAVLIALALIFFIVLFRHLTREIELMQYRNAEMERLASQRNVLLLQRQAEDDDPRIEPVEEIDDILRSQSYDGDIEL